MGVALTMAAAAAPAAATELLLYSSRHYPKEPAFEAFTQTTGITLKIFHASDAALFERLRAEGDRTPADVLVTVDAGNLWNVESSSGFTRAVLYMMVRARTARATHRPCGSRRLAGMFVASSRESTGADEPFSNLDSDLR